MALSSIFKIRSQVTEGIIELLEKTTLGTNGAMYRHLDTRKRIHEADSPLFLTMERNEKVLGNITFCKRNQDWYIRYFAFQTFAQAGKVKKSKDNANSFLKRELNAFFDDAFTEKIDGDALKSMYAYIDPNNDRSKWMSENFGFKQIAQLATQTFSRIAPKASNRLEMLSDWSEIEDLVSQNYGNHAYFVDYHAKKPPFYVLRDNSGEIIACARVTEVHWEIVRLPGKMGGLLTKIIPYLPFINRLIKPKAHTFLVPEIVCVKDNNPIILTELFSAILHSKGLNVMIWWIDHKDQIYTATHRKVNWGLIDKMIGVSPVDVVQRTANNEEVSTDRPIFVTAFDMI